MARGIIVTTRSDMLSVDEEGRVVRTYDFTSVEPHLRFAAIYWDQVEVCDPVPPRLPPTPLMRQLMAADVLKVSDPAVDIESLGVINLIDFAKEAPFRLYEKNNALAPGTWSLLPMGSLFDVPTECGISSQNVDVTLYKQLPVPSEDVPIDQILAFKHKRASELDELRESFDLMYREIVGGSESAKALNSACERVQRSVATAFRTMNESLTTRILSRLEIKIPVGAMIGAAIGGGVGGLPGALVGSLAGSFAIKVKEGKTPKGSTSGAPCAYFPAIMDELSHKGTR